MKMYRYLLLSCIALILVAVYSCESDFDLAETVVDDANQEGDNISPPNGEGNNNGEGDMNGEDTSDDGDATDDTNDGDTDTSNDNNDPGDANSGEEVTLTASSEVLTNNGEGPQVWDENVSLSALKINGSAGAVVFEKRFKDDGFGVAGGRWEQIDYYREYQGEIVMTSEKLVIDFQTPVTSVMLQVGQMDPNEGRQAKEGRTCADNNANKVDESGKWTAFDSNGMEIGQGILLDEYSIEGRLPNSMGSYRFLLDTNEQPISKIVIEATQWGGEERGCPTNRASYANEPLNDSGNTENNSEFNLMALSYTKV